uniref:Uncharacterized protein n=1 Tax=Arabidopsis thaliana TaxID=3702 RepID=Q56X50_ARATH|nr:hypothetical protein [Arabidopsis thaliana]
MNTTRDKSSLSVHYQLSNQMLNLLLYRLNTSCNSNHFTLFKLL